MYTEQDAQGQQQNNTCLEYWNNAKIIKLHQLLHTAHI